MATQQLQDVCSVTSIHNVLNMASLSNLQSDSRAHSGLCELNSAKSLSRNDTGQAD